MKKVCVFLADGFEEIEGLTVTDILRRAEIETEMVSVSGTLSVTGSHGIEIKADSLFEETDFTEAELLVLPGGMPGTMHLGEHAGLCGLLEAYDKEEKYIAAICAAPSVLGGLGILNGKNACCYPGFEEKLTGANVLTEPVVKDGHVITGRGMGNAILFALKLTETLCGRETADKIASSIIYDERG